MIKKLMAPAMALCLSGCAPLLGMLTAGLPASVPASPAAVADKTTLDEKGALGLETAYSAAARLATVAFKVGIVAPSKDADVKRANFCQLVLAGLAVVTDRGGQVAALDCKAYSALQKVRAAYDAGNATSYAAAFEQAKRLIESFSDASQGASK